jgi:hypothetical protein
MRIGKIVAAGWLHADPDIQTTVLGSAVEDADGLTPWRSVERKWRVTGNGQALAAFTTAMVVSVVSVLVPNHEMMRIQPAAAFCRIV